ncbi:rod shape-determining protein RodA [Moheibacter sp.]|uniref:rod shape-determining protein RodA n=1 Tax=Moheibacter sp. TaxID=1965316 RepID=UPI003C764F3A
MSQSRSLRGIDWTTIIMCLVLIAFGIMNIYSVDPDKGMKQLLFFGLSFVLIFGLISLSSTTSNFFEVYSPILYIGAIVLLIAVLIFGKEINGAKAWFNFGFVSFQPAEVAKLATGLLLANYVTSPSVEINSRRTIITAFTIIAIPVGLILLQPDLGSVLVFSAFIVALYREGFSAWYIFIPVIGGALFLLSISYPAYYVLTALGFLTTIICLFIIAFTYNRTLLKNIMGVQLGLIVFFILLMLMQTFFPELGAIADETAKHYADPSNLAFNVYFYSALGLVLALVSALSVSYFILRDNADSPYKMFSSEFGSNQTYEVAIIATVVFIIISGISLFSSSIYTELPKHQQERIMVLFEGEKKYRDTSGYNLLYSKTAIGSGDLLGKGYLQGTVKMGKFVPEQSTDYIFCTVGEEWGFVGSSLLVIFYGLFILRIYYLAESQRSEFSRFFGYSVATIFLIHYFINIAMVMGLFPTVGIPLPFFSYGGSSLWAFITLTTIFLILNYKDKQSLI